MKSERKTYFGFINYLTVDGALMTKARVDRNLSLLKLGEKVGVYKSTLSRYEQGQLIPPDETILSIAWTLGTLEFVKLNPNKGIEVRNKGGWGKRKEKPE